VLAMELESNNKQDLLGPQQPLNFYSQKHFEELLDQHYEGKLNDESGGMQKNSEATGKENLERGNKINLKNQTNGLNFSGLKNNVSEIQDKSANLEDQFINRSGDFDFLSNFNK
jgi:hypothetical protein